MEIDEDCNSNVFKKPFTPSQLKFNNFATNPTTTMSSFSQMNTPIRSHARRGSSGIFFNTMFFGCYRNLKRLHMESMEGLNAIKQPPARAVFRSSLPATPIATPIYRDPFPLFTEQTLMERLCRTPSPRKLYRESRSMCDDTDDRDIQPMEICSPTIVEEVSADTTPNAGPSREEIQSEMSDIYYKIHDQFNPD